MGGLQGDLAAYFIHKYGQRQLYAAVLGPLENQWLIKLLLEHDLRTPFANNNPDFKAELEGYLRQTLHQLPNLAKQLVEFGPPPDGVSGPQGDLAAYIKSQPWLESPQDTHSESESAIAPQPTSLELDAFAEDGDPHISAIDVASELDDKPQLRELPQKSGTPQPPHRDTGSAPDNVNVGITIDPATMLHAPRVAPSSEPTHQSRSVRPPGASGVKRSRLCRFLARLLFWRKRSQTPE
ncbi:hypothetical protein CVT24_008492 [Panaeolus cyanescens]|uniref:Uncharacterized protein n=1 Tax=Panaeolus cyanescens TaxID=181874 RepID=A0A409YJE2_9AGAR|nr:hypothetical protein CVT24_008492 [Panaeolus cyanescens]